MKENWVYRRGDIYLANLGVPIGSKQGGVRPVVVLQNDVGNFYSPTITAAPPIPSKILPALLPSEGNNVLAGFFSFESSLSEEQP